MGFLNILNNFYKRIIAFLFRWVGLPLTAMTMGYLVYQDFHYPTKKHNFLYRVGIAWEILVQQEYLYPPCITPKGVEEKCKQPKVRL